MTALFAVFAVMSASQNLAERTCLSHMADRFGVPVALLAAVREQEGGTVGLWQANADGSFDYGVMQINSHWLSRLAPRGYSVAVLTYDTCASIAAGAWILSNELAEAGVWRNSAADPSAYWRAVGRYHSRTPALNRAYAERVWARYARIVRTYTDPERSSYHRETPASIAEQEAGFAGLNVSAVNAGIAGITGDRGKAASGGTTGVIVGAPTFDAVPGA